MTSTKASHTQRPRVSWVDEIHRWTPSNPLGTLELYRKGCTMAITKEFTVLMDDQPGALGKLCRTLADHDVNILALQSFPVRGRAVTRFIVDDPEKAKKALHSRQLAFTETKIVQTKILNRPGEIARLAFDLGKANINISYAYCGLEPATNHPLVFFGVEQVEEAESILREAAVAAAKAHETQGP